MKQKFNLAVVLIAVLFTASCKKDNIPDTPGQKFSDDKGTYIILSTQNWMAVQQNQGGEVTLSIAGVTNADSITITTAGDGVAGTSNVTISPGSQFAGQFIISFSATSRQTGTFTSSTKLKVYKGNDVLEVPLTSGNLQY